MLCLSTMTMLRYVWWQGMVRRRVALLKLSSTTVYTPQEAMQVRESSSHQKQLYHMSLFPVQREDYTPLGSPYAKSEGEMHFEMCESMSCFNIDILDNYPEMEGVEHFNFTLMLENDAVNTAEFIDPNGVVFILPRRN